VTPHVLRDGVIERVGGHGAPWGVVLGGNLLAGTTGAPSGPGGARAVVRSGWLGEEPTAGEIPDVRMWMGEGWAALDGACDRFAAVVGERGMTPCLWPRAGDMLSDAQGCLTFLRRRESAGRARLELLLDPCGLLTASMFRRAEEHLARVFEALGAHPMVAAVVLSNVRTDAGVLAPAPLHLGDFETAMIARLAAAHVPAAVPRVFWGGDVAAQIAAAGVTAAGGGGR
jgi:hypothetical protein